MRLDVTYHSDSVFVAMTSSIELEARSSCHVMM